MVKMLIRELHQKFITFIGFVLHPYIFDTDPYMTLQGQVNASGIKRNKQNNYEEIELRFTLHCHCYRVPC